MQYDQEGWMGTARARKWKVDGDGCCSVYSTVITTVLVHCQYYSNSPACPVLYYYYPYRTVT